MKHKKRHTDNRNDRLKPIKTGGSARIKRPDDDFDEWESWDSSDLDEIANQFNTDDYR